MCRIVVFLTMLFLAGCATTTKFYMRTDRGLVLVGKINQDAPGQAEIEKDGVKMKVDTRRLSWWERNIVPIFARTIGNVSPQIEAK